MIRSKKSRFAISFILTCIAASSLGAEPNEAKMDLQFETNNQKSQLWIRRRPNEPGRGPIKPTHVAALYVRRPSHGLPNTQEGILEMLDTPSGKSLSERQREFLTASDAVTWWGIEDIQNHDMVLLYAVSEEDAKKTARAYLEVAIEKIIETKQRDEKLINQMETQISDAEKKLPEKEKQVKEVESKYKEMKDARYFSLDDGEAYDRAKETMFQMDKMLDVLEIELAGIQEKLGAINEYRRTPQDAQAVMRRKSLPDGMVAKLEQMFVEQTIELKSAEARKQAALKIRERDKVFLDRFNQWANSEREATELQKILDDSKARKTHIEWVLAHPGPEMQPPVVYQNKATIYPALTK